MNQTSLIEIDNYKIGIIRNPYERIITEYKGSWDWIGLENWLKKEALQPQCELFRDCDTVVCLENWEVDFRMLDLTPDENSMNKLSKNYSEDYRRWYSEEMKSLVDQIVRPDLDTYGYRF